MNVCCKHLPPRTICVLLLTSKNILLFCFFFNLSRNAGVRIGHHLENIIPTLIGFCHEEDASGEDKEVCLQVTQILSHRETSQIS